MSTLIEPGVYASTTWLPAMGNKIVTFNLCGKMSVPDDWQPRYNRDSEGSHNISHFVSSTGEIISLAVGLEIDGAKNFPENLVRSSSGCDIIASEDQLSAMRVNVLEYDFKDFIENQ